jgi:hypothetical protein
MQWLQANRVSDVQGIVKKFTEHQMYSQREDGKNSYQEFAEILMS